MNTALLLIHSWWIKYCIHALLECIQGRRVHISELSSWLERQFVPTFFFFLGHSDRCWSPAAVHPANAAPSLSPPPPCTTACWSPSHRRPPHLPPPPAAAARLQYPVRRSGRLPRGVGEGRRSGGGADVNDGCTVHLAALDKAFQTKKPTRRNPPKNWQNPTKPAFLATLRSAD